ncbi:TPA: hypothetical protein G9F27_000787 [Salmonella enterica]|uniref:Uncharacterized protein n=1 Tax=Salmonella enterica TaxID=28901 RepID=A0A743NZS8_SALER|nr:hypothetical protein [Salmonella enterica]
MGKGIIRAGKIPHKNTRIIAGSKQPDVATINFSFRYIDADNDKFCFTSQGASYFCKVLNRLKDLSTLTEREFIADRGATLKSHPIDWRHTSEPDGFSHLNEQFQGYTPYQFAVSRNEHGRVHGFFIGNVFHVVWLDPDHRLYPEK